MFSKFFPSALPRYLVVFVTVVSLVMLMAPAVFATSGNTFVFDLVADDFTFIESLLPEGLYYISFPYDEGNGFSGLMTTPEPVEITYSDFSEIGYLYGFAQEVVFTFDTDLIDIRRVEMDVRERNYVSKTKSTEILWSDDQNTDIQGLSVGIGSKKSKVYVRIYDKAAERGFKDRHWVRVELQLRDDRALVAMAQILDMGHVGRTVCGILRNYITFRVPSGDSNPSRWPVAYYWERVLGTMAKISLWIKPGEPYNIHKTEYWIKKQYGQVLSVLSMIQEPDLIVRECREIYPYYELAKKYRQIVDDFKRNQPARDPCIRYYNDGISIDGEFYPYEQQQFDLVDTPTPWD